MNSRLMSTKTAFIAALVSVVGVKHAQAQWGNVYGAFEYERDYYDQVYYEQAYAVDGYRYSSANTCTIVCQ